MAQFKAGELDLLVATTVIEVGVDVPNASLMIIENRNGSGWHSCISCAAGSGAALRSPTVCCCIKPRSPRQQNCVFRYCGTATTALLSRRKTGNPRAGELLGTRQTGNAEFKVADLLRDQGMLPEVQRVARHLHQNYPEQAKALIERWLPERTQYTNV